MFFSNPEKEVEAYRELVEPAQKAMHELEQTCARYSKALDIIQTRENLKPQDVEAGISSLKNQINHRQIDLEQLEHKVYAAGTIIESVVLKNKDKSKLNEEINDLETGLELLVNPDCALAELRGDIAAYDQIVQETLSVLDKQLGKMQKKAGKFTYVTNLNTELIGYMTELKEKVKALSKSNMYMLKFGDKSNFKNLEFYNPAKDIMIP